MHASMPVTNLKPDVVIVDTKQKKVGMFKLTLIWESNCVKNNIFKSDKYAHFVNDITTHKASLTAIYVGVRGQLSKKNMSKLLNLNTFKKKRKSNSKHSQTT